MSDINHIENYNISQINTTTRENCDNEVKRLNKKCQESSIKIEINTKHLFNHGLIIDCTKEYEKEIKLQESCDILKIDLLYYGENSETIEHTNILIRYKNKIFSFDTYPTVNEISFWLACNSNLNANTQTNANTIFQKDFKSCYIKSLKNAELFIDLIKNNPALLENSESINNFLNLNNSDLPHINLSENNKVYSDFFIDAPLFAIINSDMSTLKNQYFDYLIKENRILNSEDRLNALQNVKEQLGDTRLNNDQRKEINIKLEYANNILITKNVEQSKSINNFMLKQMICQQIHQVSFDDYSLKQNYISHLVDKFFQSTDRTEQLLNFVEYCQDLPKLQEKFVNETMKELYPDNPEVYKLIKAVAKDIKMDDLINNLPATHEFQSIIMTFNKFCEENKIENSYQNLLEFNKQNFKDHLQLMEDGKFGNEIDLKILETLKLKTKTMDLNVNFKTKKVIQQEKPIVKITSKTTQITNEQLKRLEESTKEIASLTDKPITKAIK